MPIRSTCCRGQCSIWKHKRSPFALDDNLRASNYGRSTCIALGLVFGIMVAMTFS
ncbi:hypothetical protein [Burkholderia ambifaria]|uniref:hypothetical protein n=1 Tax=Burkholderia ambifaria TaxID=152480 RepID=UPI0002D5F802|nr:hypothetical protein [Burkholderia ambifaria]